MITFLWPLAFLLLPLPLIIRKLAKPIAPSQAGALMVPFFNQLFANRASGNNIAKTSIWRGLLSSLIWLLLVGALVRPAFVGPEVPLPAEGRDIMMAIDLSGSMEQDDFALNGRRATRLDVVKAAADDFIDRRKGDRVGLVLFSNRAYLQAPLTFDRQVVRELLDQAQVGLTGQKTAIGDAIAVSVKRLKDRPAKGRVLILLTDGASNEGVMEPLKAAALAKELGIRIYTIGVGGEARAVNTAFGRQLVNPSQDLDEGTLREIAAETGGKYFRATDVAGLAAIYEDINKLEPVSGDPLHVRPEVALFFWPAGLALALMALMGLIIAMPALIRSLTTRSNPQIAGE
ncbi:vWA domain-containing protein [Cohaesibacter gelatinilyticus]|uniref:Ca-activated chloride channel family protein n=1 Tax=Cohaesibacter gelatinilyticus TaxID=372072 RepID=A0A285NEX5_9HYPH|nr:VWA domain-containing protein [Cohaesibacter gelatinilyticus]SNZ07517.1 Ca-activated chloride channel family protein [Cohaesibacter gelatinilyticus]